MYYKKTYRILSMGIMAGITIIIAVSYFLGVIKAVWWPVIGTTSLLITVGTSIFSYLENRTDRFMQEGSWEREYHRKLSKYTSLAGDVSYMSFLDDADKIEILAKIKAGYKDSIIEELESERDDDSESMSADDIRKEQISETFGVLESLTSRISGEISSLSTRANVNLVIGCVTTLLSAGVLIWFTQGLPDSFVNSVELLSYYIPRLSVVIFVEVFAFFFLRLYRSNLNEIKYYRNEATNIDLRHAALRSVLIDSNPEALKLVVSSFLKTERNAILKRGETTAEIETTKHLHQSDKSFVESFKSVFNSLQKFRLVGNSKEEGV
ncbi:hypothetical protein DYBT9623_04450 [Dyadobacter sp. CECT 9623]|uniref:Uncharacterized protein n=2 Tax=Dyadobacter linearis TaxID=2823330 RepID=A0ABM8UVZ3_9BACT|nr:hypothetical protein DYBT9623_04450 [Dyadobacter sp. CECT 9623]